MGSTTGYVLTCVSKGIKAFLYCRCHMTSQEDMQTTESDAPTLQIYKSICSSKKSQRDQYQCAMAWLWLEGHPNCSVQYLSQIRIFAKLRRRAGLAAQVTTYRWGGILAYYAWHSGTKSAELLLQPPCHHCHQCHRSRNAIRTQGCNKCASRLGMCATPVLEPTSLSKVTFASVRCTWWVRCCITTLQLPLALGSFCIRWIRWERRHITTSLSWHFFASVLPLRPGAFGESAATLPHSNYYVTDLPHYSYSILL